MQVKDIMTPKPVCCTPDTPIQEIARKMVDYDCGEIPIVKDMASMKPIGVVTDRDIVMRAVCEGLDPQSTPAEHCMTKPCVTVYPEDTVEDCCAVLEENQIRRVVVVDANGACCGIVAQADIARSAGDEQIAEVVTEVSQPNRFDTAIIR